MLTNGLVAYLTGQSAIAATVGNRVQPIPAPEDLSSYPVITYQVASYKTDYANDGPVAVSESRVVLDCWALRYLDARSLALVVASALSGFTGTLPDGTKVFLAEIVNMTDGFDDGSRIYKTSVHVWTQFSE